MFKKTAAIAAAVTAAVSVMQPVHANTFVNEAFAGSYLSAGATSDNFASLDILSCTDSSVSVSFRFVKNNNEQLIYTCYDGVMNDNIGTVRFTVSYQDGSYVSDGTMSITLDSWCVKLSCDSDQGQHLFDGIMYPQFELDPYSAPSQPPTFTNTTPSPGSGVSVVLNNETVSFPNGISPVILDDHTYVPLRSVFDSMGINVYWDEYQKTSILKAQSITCTKNSTIVQFARTFNETGYNVWSLKKWDGADTSSSSYSDISITELQPVIIESSSYVPLRVVSEAFGADVTWDGDTKTVYINCDTSNAYKYDAETIKNIENYSFDTARSYITADFTSVIPDQTPYYACDTKFYLFGARDQWNEVTLRISYGGYIDVTANAPAAASDTNTADAAEPDTVSPSDSAAPPADAAQDESEQDAENTDTDSEPDASVTETEDITE